MQVTAQLNYLRVSPRKVRQVTEVIKGMKVQEAQNELRVSPRGVAYPLLKLLNSAIHNAENNFKLKKDNLYIENIIVNAGPTLKRFRPRARGAAYEILKRTSKVKIVLNEIEPTPKRKLKVKKEKIVTKRVSDLEKDQLKEERLEKKKKPLKKKEEKRSFKGFFQKVFRRKAG